MIYNGVADDFLKDLKESIEKSEFNNIKPKSKNYKPSSMKCIRNMYYQMVGTEPDKVIPQYFLTGISNTGTDMHIRIQNAISNMKNNGFDCEYVDVGDFVTSRNIDNLEVCEKNGNETHLYNTKYNISFLCDGIIKYRGDYYIVEFKTEGTKKWTSRTSINPDHLNQASTYSLCLGLDKVIFIYINRDYSAMKSYLLTVTDTMKESIVSKIMECNRYIERGVVPPKPEHFKSKDCEYCPYKLTCKVQDDKDKEKEKLPF